MTGMFFVRGKNVGFDMQGAGKPLGVFQRLHHEKDIEGTGVGLAIVKCIIEKHGGRNRAESQVDCGTTFFFTFQ